MVNATDPEEKQYKSLKIAEQLQQFFPSPPIPLAHGSTFQLLVAVILSAQSTDKKVNEVTPELFSIAPDAGSLARMQVCWHACPVSPVSAVRVARHWPSAATAQVADIQHLIRVVGLAPTKAKNLQKMAQVLSRTVRTAH
jgi:endonuclease III